MNAAIINILDCLTAAKLRFDADVMKKDTEIDKLANKYYAEREKLLKPVRDLERAQQDLEKQFNAQRLATNEFFKNVAYLANKPAFKEEHARAVEQHKASQALMDKLHKSLLHNKQTLIEAREQLRVWQQREYLIFTKQIAELKRAERIKLAQRPPINKKR